MLGGYTRVPVYVCEFVYLCIHVSVSACVYMCVAYVPCDCITVSICVYGVCACMCVVCMECL